MLVKLVAICCFFISIGVFAQIDSSAYEKESFSFQIDQNLHYTSKKTTPLSRKERKEFQGHSFFPISLNYVVEARFDRLLEADTVKMPTVTGMTKYYVPYAKLSFRLNGEDCELTAYQSVRLSQVNEYKNYLFIPFKDATSGSESYGGGRYLDLTIPEGNTIILNFNKAYNPYCAYTTGYNCTIPPKENTLTVAVKAGLKAPSRFH